MTAESPNRPEDELAEFLKNLDARVTRLENSLGLDPLQKESSIRLHPQQGTSAPSDPAVEYESSGLELRIGEVGLAWFGSTILLLGIAFLMTYTYSLGYRTLASLLGYFAAAGLYLVARVSERSAVHLSRVMVGGSLALLYFATLRLHYYSPEPLIGNAVLGLSGLLIVVAWQFYLGIRHRSPTITCLAVILAVVTALLGDSAIITPVLFVVIAALGSVLSIRLHWRSVLFLSILAVYIGHLLWLIGNPMMRLPVHPISPDQYSLVHVFLCAAALFCPPLLREPSANPSVIAALLNCMGLSLIASLSAFALYRSDSAWVFLAVAVCLLICSIVQWLVTHERVTPAVYACFGYLALSIAVYGYSRMPAVFLWLSLQSLLVVSMALWFRSKILVVVNSIIFLCILAAYVIGFPSSNWVNFSFALVGHASARIMNWQKKRLTLHTELLRNIYLLIGFVFVLYALYHAVAIHYVTLTWMVAAVSYFLVSILLKNIKYRWMAMACVLVTISHLFLFDLARLDSKYRVPAFLFVGTMALAISLYYTKFRRLWGKDRK